MSKICNKYDINFTDLILLGLWLVVANLFCYFVVYSLNLDALKYYPYIESVCYSIFNIITIAFYYFLKLKPTAESVKAIFRVNKWSLLFVLVTVALIYFFSIISNILSPSIATKVASKYIADFTSSFNPIYAIAAIILASTKEEIIFREVIQVFLTNRFGWLMACACSSLFFALFHVSYSFDWLTIIYYLFFGAVFFVIREKSNSLVPVALAHCAINLIAFL